MRLLFLVQRPAIHLPTFPQIRKLHNMRQNNKTAEMGGRRTPATRLSHVLDAPFNRSPIFSRSHVSQPLVKVNERYQYGYEVAQQLEKRAEKEAQEEILS